MPSCFPLTWLSERSRGFGFIRFRSLAQATAFIDKNYPTVYFYGEGRDVRDDEAKVNICYGKERKDVDDPATADWSCISV